jgi:type IV pilus assembly protein PilM
LAKNAVIGLNLGSKTMKAVEIVAERDGFRVTRIAVRPTPESMIVNGVIIDAPMIGEAVGQMLLEEGFSGKQVVIGCGGQTDIVVRVTDVPRMDARELNKAMKYDLERHLPFPVTQARESVSYCMYSGPGDDPSGPTMELTITALKDEACNKQMEIVKRARRRIEAIDAEPFAIGRALVSAAPESPMDRCVALVDLGQEATNIAMVHHNWLRFSRSVPMAGDTFSAAVGQELIVQADEAEELKLRYSLLSTMDYGGDGEASGGEDDYGGGPEPGLGMALDDDETAMFSGLDEGPVELGDVSAGGGGPADVGRAVSDALRSVVSELGAEVSRSIEYYRSHHDDVEIDKVLLVGGSSLIANLAPVMQAELGELPTEIGDPFSGLIVDPGAGYTEEALARLGPVVAVATGLALYPWADALEARWR